jgi:hypothetical protein
MPKAVALFGILLAGVGLFLTRLPYLGLAARLASGEIDGNPIAVVAFKPAPFEEKTKPVRLGGLVFDFPSRARIESYPSDDLSSVRVDLDGLKCRVLSPRQREDGEGDCHDMPGWAAVWGEDRIDHQAAICSASGQDLSLWMSPVEVQRLRDQLEARPFCCLNAERVEVVRGETLSGLLLIWTNEGRPRMAFEYLSPDNRVAGTALLFADVDSDQALAAARSLLSTFRLEPS